MFKNNPLSTGLFKLLIAVAGVLLLPASTLFCMPDPALFSAPTDFLSPLYTSEGKSAEPDPALSAALQLLERQAYDEALAKVKVVLAKNPDSSEAHEILGVVLAKQSSLDEALKEFRKAADLDPHRSAPFTKMGDIYLAKQDVATAKTYLLQAVAIDPTDYRAHQRLGLIYKEEGDVSLAMDHFEKGIVGPPPDYIGVKVDLAALYNQTHQFSKTVSLLENLVRPETRNPAAHFELGTAYLALKRGNDAIASFSHMREFCSDPTRAQVALGIAYREAGDLQQSLRELDTAISSKPESPLAHYEKGNTLVAMQNPREAIQSYSTAAQYSPAPVQIRNRIAEILANEKQYDAAVEAYEKIRSEGIANMETYDGLAAVYKATGKFDDAKVILLEASEKAPSPYAFLRLGLFYGYTRQYDLAKEALVKANSLSSADPRILKALSLVYLRAGDRNDAIVVAKKLLETVPTSVEDRFYLGTLLDEEKDYVGAAAEYEHALRLDPKYVTALNNLAIIQMKLGKLDEASYMADLAVSLAPDDPVLLDTQGWILFNKSEFSKASGTLEKAVAKDGQNPTYHYHLAASYEKLRKREKALNQCNKAIESSLSFPERPEAQVLMKRLK